MKEHRVKVEVLFQMRKHSWTLPRGIPSHRETPAPGRGIESASSPFQEWLCPLRVYFAFKANSESVWTAGHSTSRKTHSVKTKEISHHVLAQLGQEVEKQQHLHTKKQEGPMTKGWWHIQKREQERLKKVSVKTSFLGWFTDHLFIIYSNLNTL